MKLRCVMRGALLALVCVHGAALAQVRVLDVFDRELNERGITLVDWDGYMANPLIQLYCLPPTNAVLPGSALLRADGERLYFGEGGTVGAAGPATTLYFYDMTTPVPVSLSIFPAHQDADADATLTIQFTEWGGAKQTNAVGIQVVDEGFASRERFCGDAGFWAGCDGVFRESGGAAIGGAGGGGLGVLFCGHGAGRDAGGDGDDLHLVE